MRPHITPDTRANQTIERWLPIAGYEGMYEVSSHGRVRSLDREDSAGRPRRGRVLRPALSSGYPYVHLHKESQGSAIRIHALVANAFLGERPEGYTVNHIDGVKTNNCVENLEYMSCLDNVRHACSLGLVGKLNKEQVWEIREAFAFAPAPSLSFFAEKFDVSLFTIQSVLSAKHYNNIPNPDGSTPRAIPVRNGIKGVDVQELFESGHSLGAIGRMYNVTTATVSRAYLRTAGHLAGKARGKGGG